MAVHCKDDFFDALKYSDMVLKDIPNPCAEIELPKSIYSTEYIYERLMNYIDNHVQNGTTSCDKTELRKFYHSYFGEINRDNGSNVDTFMLDLVTHGIGAYYKEKSFSSGDKT